MFILYSLGVCTYTYVHSKHIHTYVYIITYVVNNIIRRYPDTYYVAMYVPCVHNVAILLRLSEKATNHALTIAFLRCYECQYTKSNVP